MRCRVLLVGYLLLSLCTLSVCGCGLLNTDPMVDTTVDEEGNILVADTARTWSDFLKIADMSVAHEAAGWDPPAS